MPVVQLAAHAKSSTLYGRSYDRTVVHPNFLGLMGYYYIVSLWGYALRAPLWIYAVENSRLKIEYGCSGFNPLTPMSDWHLISPYIITPESNIKVRRIKEMIIIWRSIVCSTNSPCQLLGKCIENSIENMHGDQVVKG